MLETAIFLKEVSEMPGEKDGGENTAYPYNEVNCNPSAVI